MTPQERLNEVVASALNEIVDQELGRNRPQIPSWRRNPNPPPPLPIGQHIAARLTILAAVREWESAFIKETKADREAIEAYHQGLIER